MLKLIDMRHVPFALSCFARCSVKLTMSACHIVATSSLQARAAVRKIELFGMHKLEIYVMNIGAE